MAMPGRGGILTCHLEDMETLYASYLYLATNGALFVPSERIQKLGDEGFIAVTLHNSSERLPMNGKVVWINSKSQSGRPAGFAVQIGTDIAWLTIKNEVELLLAGKIYSLQSTYNM